jgi:hypothetical protein
MKSLVIFVNLLILCGCSNGLEFKDSKVYQFSGNSSAYFPNEIVTNLDTTKGELFNRDVYTELLHQLHEESLSDKFKEIEIIRLTVKNTFENHFMIKIEKRDDGKFMLIEKIVWRSEGVLDSANYMIGESIQFDSNKNKFFRVKTMYKNPLIELEREEIEPVSKTSEKEISEKQWSDLIILLKESSFYSMRPRVADFGLDGGLFLIETHSGSGYYVVDRWSPDKGGFKQIVDYITSLAGRHTEI